MDKLTAEQLLKDHDYFERGGCPTCGGKEIYDALKDTMRENERLRDALRKQADRHDSLCRIYDKYHGCTCGAKQASDVLAGEEIMNKLLIECVAKAILSADDIYGDDESNDPTAEWYRAHPDNPQFVWQLYIPHAEAAIEAIKSYKHPSLYVHGAITTTQGDIREPDSWKTTEEAFQYPIPDDMWKDGCGETEAMRGIPSKSQKKQGTNNDVDS